jgi:hypothetical protein
MPLVCGWRGGHKRYSIPSALLGRRRWHDEPAVLIASARPPAALSPHPSRQAGLPVQDLSLALFGRKPGAECAGCCLEIDATALVIQPELRRSQAAPTTQGWPLLVDELNRLLRLKTTPIGMKLFEHVEDMLAIPKLRRPGTIHTTDQTHHPASAVGRMGALQPCRAGGVQVSRPSGAPASRSRCWRRQRSCSAWRRWCRSRDHTESASTACWHSRQCCGATRRHRGPSGHVRLALAWCGRSPGGV